MQRVCSHNKHKETLCSLSIRLLLSHQWWSVGCIGQTSSKLETLSCNFILQAAVMLGLYSSCLPLTKQTINFMNWWWWERGIQMLKINFHWFQLSLSLSLSFLAYESTSSPQYWVCWSHTTTHQTKQKPVHTNEYIIKTNVYQIKWTKMLTLNYKVQKQEYNHQENLSNIFDLIIFKSICFSYIASNSNVEN